MNDYNISTGLNGIDNLNINLTKVINDNQIITSNFILTLNQSSSNYIEVLDGYGSNYCLKLNQSTINYVEILDGYGSNYSLTLNETTTNYIESLNESTSNYIEVLNQYSSNYIKSDFVTYSYLNDDDKLGIVEGFDSGGKSWLQIYNDTYFDLKEDDITTILYRPEYEDDDDNV